MSSPSPWAGPRALRDSRQSKYTQTQVSIGTGVGGLAPSDQRPGCQGSSRAAASRGPAAALAAGPLSRVPISSRHSFPFDGISVLLYTCIGGGRCGRSGKCRKLSHFVASEKICRFPAPRYGTKWQVLSCQEKKVGEYLGSQ